MPAGAVALLPFGTEAWGTAVFGLPGLKDVPALQQDIAPLLEAGYTVFVINHRAAPRFQHPAPVDDVRRAVRFVRTRASEFGIDPRHLGAVGVSSGAMLASLATLSGTAATPDDPDPVNRVDATVQAFVGVAMPADLTQSIDNPAGAVMLTSYLGRTVFPGPQQQSPELAALRSISPLQHVTGAAPPMLLIHADQDALVPPSQAVAMSAALEAAGVPQKLVIIRGANHGQFLVPGVPDYRVAMVEWLRLHVGPQQQAQ